MRLVKQRLESAGICKPNLGRAAAPIMLQSLSDCTYVYCVAHIRNLVAILRAYLPLIFIPTEPTEWEKAVRMFSCLPLLWHRHIKRK